MFLNIPATKAAHPPSVVRERAMRGLPVQLPPMTLERRGSPLREVFFGLVAFAAMFGAALLGLNLLF
jgi:hypothetical protein